MNEFRIFYIADLMEKISIIDLKSVIFSFVSENTISRIYLINRGNVGGWMNVEKLSLVIGKLVKNRDMIKNNRTISQNLYLVMKNVLHRL